MIKVIYEDPLIVDSATGRSAIVIVAMDEWKESSNGQMFAEIKYLAKDIVSGAETVIQGKSKTVEISEEKYNQMCWATDSQIPDELTPYQKRKLRKRLSLLLFVQTDLLDGTDKCIYGTEPSKWKLCEF